MEIPSSTYRVQLRPEFTFDDARGIVSYLRQLGVGAMYLSPSLEAMPGSTHGYDIVDPTKARSELGGESARLRLIERLRQSGLDLVVDVVPNHLSVEDPPINRWWWDVLQYGRESRYASYFDIDFSRERILIPVLGSDSDLSQLSIKDGELTYYEHRFPLAPGTEAGTPQEVHARQHYELAYWKRGNSELNYRRFFDVTTLAAVKVEDPEVFAATHAEILRWVRAGEVSGLRIDHPDGLTDPGGYLRRLRESAPDTWLVVEKILHPGETLPSSWSAEGTTGYDALREICGVFIDPSAKDAFTYFTESHGVSTDFLMAERTSRTLVAENILVAEIRRIAALVKEIDFDTARRAVAELMIAFPVYRSYLPEGEAHWDLAIRTARKTHPELSQALNAVNQQVKEEPEGELAKRIQQTSGMVVAKGTEDTAFYRYSRFIALNEVGGSPTEFGLSTEKFHALAAAREAGWPATMTALSTHDTKRAEDVRARLAVLSELPDEFFTVVDRWSERYRIEEPSLNLVAWQTIVGAWPLSAERLGAYLIKAAREAKIRTSWLEPDEAFENALSKWVNDILGDASLVTEIDSFVDRIKAAGWTNSLGQKLLQLAGPGVPDVYQGSELWDFSLVDPDNRRLVDYDLRQRMLSRILSGAQPSIEDSGAAKMLVVHKVLALRREQPELFSGYRPLFADGPAAEHVVAFTRNESLAIVATRLPIKLANSGGWRETAISLPESVDGWTDILTGKSRAEGSHAEKSHTEKSLAPVHKLKIADLFEDYPVALLVRENGVSR
jgi:(1->4)-alpha-D-glucan 1-alpha-D-glucosylmutase